MKTTIEISDALLREARKLAAREGVTLRALVERGLHRVIADTKQAPPFRMRDGSFGGNWLQPEVRDLSWAEILEMSYEGRGGRSLEQILRDKTDKERSG
jgi:Bacterial antitoxin of type II TA system, VapB